MTAQPTQALRRLRDWLFMNAALKTKSVERFIWACGFKRFFTPLTRLEHWFCDHRPSPETKCQQINACHQSHHPAEFVNDEMDYRGWVADDLIKRTNLGRVWVQRFLAVDPTDLQTVDEPIALELAKAFGTSKELWLNLQASYDRHQQRERDITDYNV